MKPPSRPLQLLPWQSWALGVLVTLAFTVSGYLLQTLTLRLDRLEAHGAPIVRERLANQESNILHLHETTQNQHREILSELEAHRQEMVLLRQELAKLSRCQ